MHAFEQMQAQVLRESVIALDCQHGLGRSTILRRLAKEYQAVYIRLADVYESIEGFVDPLKTEEGFLKVIRDAWQENDVLVIDDFHQIYDSLAPFCSDTARPHLLPIATDVILKYLEHPARKLIIGLKGDWTLPLSITSRYRPVSLDKWTPEDFKHVLLHYGGHRLEAVDFNQVYRFARKLNAYQLKQVCHYLADTAYSTESLLQLLETRTLISNVNTGEVAALQLSDLYGVDEVIQQLEVDLITPIERPDLVHQLGITPKRGILLYGPPGTGKTSIGRALAHRLKSKFFLIDGTVISGTSNFYDRIHNIFEKAKANAPCILFIDDSDLLFEQNQNQGLYRYLLTMLDGLESESNAAVTIFMTAMNVSSLPPALIRSGRVELWLEMQLPDLAARKHILATLLEGGFLKLDKTALTSLANMAADLTGADLKRVYTDAVNRYGYDVANQLPLRKDLAYLEDAVDKLLSNRKKVIRDRELNKEKEKMLPYWMS